VFLTLSVAVARRKMLARIRQIQLRFRGQYDEKVRLRGATYETAPAVSRETRVTPKGKP